MSPTETNSITATLSLALIVGLGWTGVASQAAISRPQGATTNQRLQQMQQQPNNVSAPPLYVPGELVVRLATGATPQDAQGLAGYFGAQVGRKLRFAPNTYVFKNVQGNLDTAVQQLRTSPAVLAATKNQVFRPAALPPSEPNDTLYPQQWALKSSGAVDLWGITVGQRLVDGPKKQVTVALLDSGPQTSHPDLAENFDTVNGWDFILDQQYDETAANQFFFEAHGTEVASCIAPLTNNSQGIAGFPWEGVKILPCRVADFFGSGTLNAGIPVSAVVDAIYYSIQQQVDVINMSFGLAQQDPLVEQAILDAYNQGIVPVASSGDGFFFSRAVEFPANLDETIAVAAVGPAGEVATYSNSGPEVDIAAPGGNDQNFNDTTRQLVLAQPTGFFGGFNGLPNGYGIDQGTSFAAGYASGAIATLITQGAAGDLTGPERVEAIRDLLQTTARNPFGVPTPQLGYGQIDVARAIKQITQYVDVVAPEPNEVTASLSEPLVARIVLPIPMALDDSLFEVFKNGTDVTPEAEITDPLSGFIRYAPPPEDSYKNSAINTVNVVTINPVDGDSVRSLEGDAVVEAGVNIPARAFRFRVKQHVEYPGLKTFSIPYELEAGTLADTLPFLLGGNEGRLARWLPEQGRYAIFDPFGSPEEAEADLTTDNAGVVAPPVGVGFWLRILPPELPPPPDGQPAQDPNSTQIPLQIRGASERAPFYRIPLKPGFNLVGNPYTFRVPFNVVNVQYGNEVMSVAEASRRNLMKNVIWRYEGGRYTFKVLPQGEFIPWEAHWLQAATNLTLIVPRVGSGLGVAQAAPGPKVASVPAGGWVNSFRASTGGRILGEVFLGQSGRTRSELAQLQLPPAPQGIDDLRVQDRRAGRLAQDLRPGSSAQTWTLEYETSHPGEAVQLAWDAFPKNLAAVVRVNGGKPVSGNLSRSLTFTPGSAGVHRIQVSVLPLARGKA